MNTLQQASLDLVYLEGGLVATCGMKWSSADPVYVGRVLKALKGGHCQWEWRGLALQFLIKYEKKIISGLERRKPVFIVPRSSQYPDLERDHSYLWASGLREVLGGDIELAFKAVKKGQLEQKKLNRKERFKHQIQLPYGALDPILAKIKGRPLIFADDVVTTGSTAQAISLALERPPGFNIWALAYRMSLRK